MCASVCSSYGYDVFGLEDQSQCYCGEDMPPGDGSADGCNETCPGDRNLMCGGPMRLDVYSSAAAASATVTDDANSSSSVDIQATMSVGMRKVVKRQGSDQSDASGIVASSASAASAWSMFSAELSAEGIYLKSMFSVESASAESASSAFMQASGVDTGVLPVDVTSLPPEATDIGVEPSVEQSMLDNLVPSSVSGTFNPIVETIISPPPYTPPVFTQKLFIGLLADEAKSDQSLEKILREAPSAWMSGGYSAGVSNFGGVSIAGDAEEIEHDGILDIVAAALPKETWVPTPTSATIAPCETIDGMPACIWCYLENIG
jgi:WSC domain